MGDEAERRFEDVSGKTNSALKIKRIIWRKIITPAYPSYLQLRLVEELSTLYNVITGRYKPQDFPRKIPLIQLR